PQLGSLVAIGGRLGEPFEEALSHLGEAATADQDPAERGRRAGRGGDRVIAPRAQGGGELVDERAAVLRGNAERVADRAGPPVARGADRDVTRLRPRACLAPADRAKDTRSVRVVTRPSVRGSLHPVPDNAVGVKAVRRRTVDVTVDAAGLFLDEALEGLGGLG